MVQDPPAPTLDPQVLVWEKVVEPVIVMPLIVSVALPTFVSVTVCGGGGQVGGSSWQEKDRLAGTSFTTVPVPLRETFWGLSAAQTVNKYVAPFRHKLSSRLLFGLCSRGQRSLVLPAIR